MNMEEEYKSLRDIEKEVREEFEKRGLLGRRFVLGEIISWYSETQCNKLKRNRLEWKEVIKLLTMLGYYGGDFIDGKK